MVSSIPMVVNLLQPLGAYFADRTQSRHNYCLWVFGVSSLLWLILVFGIAGISWICQSQQPLLESLHVR